MIRRCQKGKITITPNQPNINRLCSPPKIERAFPDRVKQDTNIAYVEFAAIVDHSQSNPTGRFKKSCTKTFSILAS